MLLPLSPDNQLTQGFPKKLHSLRNRFSPRMGILTFPPLNKWRLAFVLLCFFAGLYIGLSFSSGQWFMVLLCVLLGSALGGVGLLIEKRILACSPFTLIGGSVGLMVGMTGTGVFLLGLSLSLPSWPPLSRWIGFSALLLFPYIGITIGRRIFQYHWKEKARETTPGQTPEASSDFSQCLEKIIDTSAIIDGRILALCSTGFLEGPVILPQCVLIELQTLADSENYFKRVRVKRGLEVLSELHKLPNWDVSVVEDHDSRLRSVDHQLISIARNRNAKILTNDWNLTKIADLQGVKSLNVNELTYNLRPLVLPGERIRVLIQKEGQGRGQGIAHLDDGTMIVIDHGASLVGKTIEVEVTRFMQTSTGRMIFASPKPDDHSSPLKPSSFPQQVSLPVHP